MLKDKIKHHYFTVPDAYSFIIKNLFFNVIVNNFTNINKMNNNNPQSINIHKKAYDIGNLGTGYDKHKMYRGQTGS